MKNKIEGFRDKNGELNLYVDGKRLSLKDSLKVWNHSPTGFGSGYGGSGPAQSALAILLQVLKDKTRAIRLHQDFKFEFLAKPEYQEGDFEFEVSIIEWANLKELGY